MRCYFPLAALFLLVFIPESIGQISWKRLNGPTGLRNSSLSVSANGVLFLGQQGFNQLDLSFDYGETWESHDLPAGAPFTLPELVHLTNGNSYAAYDHQLFKYQYAANDWVILPGFNQNEAIYSDNQQRLWKHEPDGALSFSTNEGSSFTQVLSDVYDFDSPIAVHNDAHNLFVSNTLPNHTLYHFNTSGQKQAIPLNINNLFIKYLAFNPYSGVAYMYTNDVSAPLKKSLDGGFTWSAVDFGPNLPFDPDIRKIHFQTSGAIWMVCGAGVLKSPDEGETWTKLKIDGYDPYFPPGFGITPDAQKIFVYDGYCGEQEFYRSLDFGNNWTILSNKLFKPEINRIQKSPDGRIYAEACRRSNVELSADEGQSWFTLKIHTTDTTYLPSKVCVTSSGLLFTAVGGDVYRSFNYGSTWTKLDFQGFPVFLDQRVVAAPNGILYMLHAGNNNYKSENDGESWTPVDIQAGFTTGVYPGDHFHPNGNFYRAAAGNIFKYNQAQDYLEYIPLPAGNIQYAFTVTKTGRLISIISEFNTFFIKEIYISDDEGQSFQKVGNVPEFPESAELISGPDMILMRLDDKYYRSLDDGLTWNLYFQRSDFPAYPLCHYFSADHYLYFGLQNEVIHRSTEKLVAAQDLPDPANGVSIFPNPAGPTLNIAAKNDFTGSIQFKLYDALGRVQLHREAIDLSAQPAAIDLKGLPVGLYYCVIHDEKGNRLYAEKLVKE